MPTCTVHWSNLCAQASGEARLLAAIAEARYHGRSFCPLTEHRSIPGQVCCFQSGNCACWRCIMIHASSARLETPRGHMSGSHAIRVFGFGSLVCGISSR
eukprot:6239616-Amphidinium_carterae.1